MAPMSSGAEATFIVKESDFQPLRLLTWNIAGEQTSASGPAWWTTEDKIAAMRREIGRWDPDVVALQECPGPDRWAGLDDSMEQVGAARAHAGFVHLYVKRVVPSERVGVTAKCPWVVAELKLRGGTVKVASVHLAPGEGAAEERLKQVRQIAKICGGGSVVVLGDLNVREDEMEDVRKAGEFFEAMYAGKTWDPRRNGFDGDLKLQRDVAGQAFDRILYVGGVFVQSYMVGVGRLFSDGVGFCLSDHYGLLGMMDVHECHGGTGARAEVSRRRLALSRLRDLACAKEQSLVLEQERDRIQRDKEEQMAKEEGRLVEAQEEMLKAVKKRYEARLALRRQAFGESALFGPGSDLRFATKMITCPEAAVISAR